VFQVFARGDSISLPLGRQVLRISLLVKSRVKLFDSVCRYLTGLLRILRMDKSDKRRKLQRLHFNWPVWFAEDFNDVLFQGQMSDVSTGGMSFTYHKDHKHLWAGQQVTIRFSVPRFGPEDDFRIANFTRTGHISDVGSVNGRVNRAAVQFAQPLPFDPNEPSQSVLQKSEAEAILA